MRTVSTTRRRGPTPAHGLLPVTLVVAGYAAGFTTLPACAQPRLAPHPPATEAPMSPRLYRVIQPVKDIEAAAHFYAALFELPGERVSPGRHYFDLGGTILAVYDPAADGDPLGEGWLHHESQYLYFAVADLEGALARAREAGATIQRGIASMPWGERLFYALDPSGNPICLVDESTLFTGGGAPAGEGGVEGGSD